MAVLPRLLRATLSHFRRQRALRQIKPHGVYFLILPSASN